MAAIIFGLKSFTLWHVLNIYPLVIHSTQVLMHPTCRFQYLSSADYRFGHVKRDKWPKIVPFLGFYLSMTGCLCKLGLWRCGGWMDSTWDSEYASHGFESQCCQLVNYVTSLGKMWTPCMPYPTSAMVLWGWQVKHHPAWVFWLFPGIFTPRLDGVVPPGR